MSNCERDVTSILDGVTELIEDWLGIAGIPKFGKDPISSKTAAIELSNQGSRLNGAASDEVAAAELAKSVLTKIEENHVTMGRQLRGKANWCIRRESTIANHNSSPEKRLEKLLVSNFTMWFNQVPTCSGMAHAEEGKRCVDLGCPTASQEVGGFELIELKFGDSTQNHGSDNPLYAGFEHFQYAALYIICRQLFERGQASFDDLQLLTARRTDWIVWAPRGFYGYRLRSDKNANEYRFEWLERVLSSALQSAARSRLKDQPLMRFQFCTMTPELEVILTSYKDNSEQSLNEALIRRISIFSQGVEG